MSDAAGQGFDWNCVNNNAFVNRDEVVRWLRLKDAGEIIKLIRNAGFPIPDYGCSWVGRITSTSRWKCERVRKWLRGEAVTNEDCPFARTARAKKLIKLQRRHGIVHTLLMTKGLRKHE